MAEYRGTSGNDQHFAGDGDDTAYGGGGDDSIGGGAGNDIIYLGDGDDYSGYLDDLGDDSVFGESGNDRINFFGTPGRKYLDGGDGDDDIGGGSQADTLIGGQGRDTLFGNGGADLLVGGDGDDQLIASDADDTLDGGSGSNDLYGGRGSDTYIVRSRLTRIHDESGSADRAEVHSDFVKLPSFIETVSHVGGAQALPYWIDCLLPDPAVGGAFAVLLGGDRTFGFCFPESLPSYSASSRDADGYTPFSTMQQVRTVELLDYVSTVVDINFARVNDADAPNVLTFANNRQSGSAGYAYYPDAGQLGSDVFIDDAQTDFSDGRYGATTLVHEVGHALGLKHPHNEGIEGLSDGSEGPYLSDVSVAEDHLRWTVMTYTPADSSLYRLRFSPLDIAALHYLYGPSRLARAGDDVYITSQTEPNFVWDGSGTDTLDASAASAGATLYLEPGYWGHIGAKATNITAAGQVTVNFGSVIENLIGTAFDDVLHGTAGANVIAGGAGDDVIHGLGGGDSVDGGEGADVVVYRLRSADVSIERQAGVGFAVSFGAGVTDRLSRVEVIRFLDAEVDAASLNNLPTGSVRIAGVARQGAVLIASHDLADADGLGAIGYQWFANGLALGGETRDQLVLTQSLVGSSITVTAAYVDAFGIMERISSAATARVADVNDAPSGQVVVVGTPVIGGELLARSGLSDLDGLGQITFQWFADGLEVPGATGMRFSPGQAQVGSLVSVRASYVDDAGNAESIFSAPTAPIARAAIVGTATKDSLPGTALADLIQGLAGNDTLRGGDGDDTLSGGEGKDLLVGGRGDDIFTFDALPSAKSVDLLEDFSEGDSVALSARVFRAFAPGQELVTGNLVFGRKAIDGDDFLILNGNKLFYDPDGSGKIKPVQIATIGVAPSGVGQGLLSASDIEVF